MCIIRNPIQSVSGTKIFVAPSTDFSRQLTVYLNTVSSERPNMMILPVPYPETVQFHTGLMVYTDIFKDAAASIDRQRLEVYRSARALKAPLPVFQIGSYRVSIAATLTDLTRLEPEIFGTFPTELSSMLWRTYGREHLPVPYGFLCCMLEPGQKAYEPLAYSHRALPTGLFIPTKHFHGHEEDAAADWDHEVYSIVTEKTESHTLVSSDQATHYIPSTQNQIQWSRFPPEFQHSPLKPIHCWRKLGIYINKDLLLPFEPYSRDLPEEELEDPSPRAPTPPSPSGRGLAKLLGGLRGVFQ